MPLELFAVERTWFAVSPDGVEHVITFRIGSPVLQGTGVWLSSVSLGALDSHVSKIVGENSWQALSEAMRFTSIRVGHFAELGWQFYWERGGEQASASDLASA